MWPSAKISCSYSFHVPWTIPSNVYFYIVLSMFLFLFNTGVISQMDHSCFRKRASIIQLNIQAAMAVKEKLYTLSKKIYIKF